MDFLHNSHLLTSIYSSLSTSTSYGKSFAANCDELCAKNREEHVLGLIDPQKGLETCFIGIYKSKS